MVFAHVKFERRAARLADVITRKEGFGKKTAAAWSARDRPKEFKNLCARYQRKHPEGLPEARSIVQRFKHCPPDPARSALRLADDVEFL